MPIEQRGNYLFGLCALAFALTFCFAAFFVAPAAAFAATLSFTPATKTVAVGDIFNIAVDVSSPSQAMNAVSGDVTFPTNQLRVLSVSNSNSVMTLWVQNPSFSNAAGAGDINFAGIVLNPGYTGNLGNVVTIQFKAVGVGDAPLSFSDGSVLANDGNGTNILTSMGTADMTVVSAPTLPPASTAPVTVSTSTTGISSVPSSSATSMPTAPSSTNTVPAVTSTVAPTPAPTVTVNYSGAWLTEALQFLFTWGIIILLGLLLLAAIIALAYYLTNRLRRLHVSLSRRLIQERKELRDDLRRIQKELEADGPSAEIDLSPSGIRKKQERIRREIEHLDEDLKRDIKEDEK